MLFKSGDRVLCDISCGENDVINGLHTTVGVIVNVNHDSTYNIMSFVGSYGVELSKNIPEDFIVCIESNHLEERNIEKKIDELVELEMNRCPVDKEKIRSLQILKDMMLRNISDKRIQTLFEDWD